MEGRGFKSRQPDLKSGACLSAVAPKSEGGRSRVRVPLPRLNKICYTQASMAFHRIGLFFVILSIFIAPIARATDYSSTNFIIRDPVISVGGNLATSTSFQLFSSEGQTVAGENSSASFIQRSGFLYFPAPSSGSSPSPSPSPSESTANPGDTTRGPGGGAPATPPSVVTVPIVVPTSTEDEIPPTATVTFRGYGAPSSRVNVLQDGTFVGRTDSNTDGTFSVTISDVPAGEHTFSLYNIDNEERHSTSVEVTLNLAAGTTEVTRLAIPPTMSVDRAEADVGVPIILRGSTVPNSRIQIRLMFSGTPIFFQGTAGATGAYTFTIPTTARNPGTYLLQTQMAISSLGITSGLSDALNLLISSPQTRLRADLNVSGRVGSDDFDVLVLWYHERAAGRTPVNQPAQNPDINRDNQITLVDFSIMAFYWTG